MEFVRTEVNGVPTFWTEAGDDLRAGLVFRVGRADERLPRSGITHMVEHLALYPLGLDEHLHYNGQVDDLTTTFLVQGGTEKVAAFFRSVCASLRDLPFARLEKETQVLRSEAETRKPGMGDFLLRVRYGAGTYGLAAYPEFGIGAMTPEEMSDWVSRWFTRGNAALWIAGGPPPEELELDLPEGRLVRPPAPANALRTAPAFFSVATQALGLCCSGVVPRSAASQVYAHLLKSRLMKDIRHDQALSYSPGAAYLIRDDQYAHVVASADGLPESFSRLVPAFIREMEELASAAAGEGELKSAVEALHTGAEKAVGSVHRVAQAARNELMGRPTGTFAAWKERIGSVTAEDVLQAARQMNESLLLALPGGYEPPHAKFAKVLCFSGAPVAGRIIRSVDYPFEPSGLVVGSDGVSVVKGEAAMTVRYLDCAALLRWSDGARHLIGRDGTGIHIEPTMWRTTADVIKRIDGRVAAENLVTMPYRAREDVPRARTRSPQRLFARLVRHPLMVVIVGTAPVVAALIAFARLVPRASGIGAVVLVPAIGVSISVVWTVRVRLWAAAARKLRANRVPEVF